MRFENVYIPYGRYWSTPFVKWQGAFATEHSLKFAARSARRMLDEQGVAPEQLDRLHYGLTVPQQQSFFGAPWIAAMIGNDRITGPTISQACATSARVVASAACEVELGQAGLALAAAGDRTSNGPVLYHPDPLATGGTGRNEVWVLDNFNKDPYARCAMVQTAENVATASGATKAEQDALVLHRYGQYQAALAEDRAFQRRYMQADIEIRDGRGRKVLHTVSEDQGVTQSTAEGLDRLGPVMEGGTVSFGAQTHPADGNAGALLANKETLAEINPDGPTVQLLAYGEARAEKAHMGIAPVPAAQCALQAAGLGIDQIDAVKTHNPFVVNDIYFARETGFAAEKMNNYGSSLIFGHPQGPTGLRSLIELIEELEIAGGGYGLFTGCAAGDTGAALIVKVG